MKGGIMKTSDKSRRWWLKHSRVRGVVLVWVAVFLLLLVLILGLALDTAKVFLVSHQLQNAADAAALAGVRVIKEDPNNARLIAIDIAKLNFADGNSVLLGFNWDNLPEGDIVAGRYTTLTSTFEPFYNKTPNALKVVARRTNSSLGGPVGLNFGPIVNVDTANISRYAIAKLSGGTGAGLIALSEDETGLRMSGGIGVDVKDGAIQINSEIDPPVTVDGQSGQISADEMNIVSPYETKGNLPEDLDVEYGQPPIPDPLAGLEPPTWDPAADLSPSPGQPLTQGDVTEGVPLEPGYYSGGFRFTGGDITLNPGIYILDGSSTGQQAGLYINGGNFNAQECMFYITGDGVVYLGGNGSIVITELYPIDSGEYYEGMSIFQDRNNHNDATIIGTNMMDLTGTIYFPENHVELGGTGIGLGNQFIADTMWIHGTGTFTINYDGRNMATGGSVYLVE